MSGDYFFDAFGFEEPGNYADTWNQLRPFATFTRSPAATYLPPGERCVFSDLPNGRTIDCGTFSTPSVEELHAIVKAALSEENAALNEQLAALRAARISQDTPLVTLRNIVGESNGMHSDESLRGAVFQAASQFNYLEFPGPNCKPENGVTCYMFDRTQGPACATACAGGTAYRNYFAQVDPVSEDDSQRGQRADHQFNGLSDATESLLASQSEMGSKKMYYKVRNGYVESSEQLLTALNEQFTSNPRLHELISSKLRIGIHMDVQVTSPGAGLGLKIKLPSGKWGYDDSKPAVPHFVSQTYNSALSVGYSNVHASLWAPLAQSVLSGTYEATLLFGVLVNLHNMKSGKATVPILLTKVGGGVFGNHSDWIKGALRHAIAAVTPYGIPLDLQIVHFRDVEQDYVDIANVS